MKELLLRAKASLDWIEENENISEIILNPLYQLIRKVRNKENEKSGDKKTNRLQRDKGV